MIMMVMTKNNDQYDGADNADDMIADDDEWRC